MDPLRRPEGPRSAVPGRGTCQRATSDAPKRKPLRRASRTTPKGPATSPGHRYLPHLPQSHHRSVSCSEPTRHYRKTPRRRAPKAPPSFLIEIRDQVNTQSKKDEKNNPKEGGFDRKGVYCIQMTRGLENRRLPCRSVVAWMRCASARMEGDWSLLRSRCPPPPFLHETPRPRRAAAPRPP